MGVARPRCILRAPARRNLINTVSTPQMQWFRQIDKDRSGTLDVHELQQALALGRINFSLKTVQCIIRLYDSDGDGKIGVEVGSWRGLNCDVLL